MGGILADEVSFFCRGSSTLGERVGVVGVVGVVVVGGVSGAGGSAGSEAGMEESVVVSSTAGGGG